MQDRPGASSVRFDAFEIDLQAGELRREGRRIKLQEQPFRVLSMLLQRAGGVVTREELRVRLWPADTFVDFDHGLNSAVARLREALRDSADKPRFIETISKRGYRFIAPLHSTTSVLPNAGAETATKNKGIQAALKMRIGAAFVVATLAAVTIWALRRPNADSQLARIEVVPLVGLRGFQATPAFSPDGTLVAFRQSDGARNAGIYAAAVAGGKSVQVTSSPGDCCPTWSPRGDQIAFMRYSRKTVSIYTVPPLGGTERRVYQGPAAMVAGLSWSPDGRALAFPQGTTGDPTRANISLLSLADFSIRPLSLPPPGWLDHQPVFSPDGSQIAFIRSTVAGVSNDVFVMPATGGQAKRLTFDNRPIMGPPAWTANGREIIFSSNRSATTGLWRVSANGGFPIPVAGPEGEAKWPSLPAKGDALVYEQWVSKANIWRLDLRDARHLQKPPAALVTEKGDKMRPELSPNGRKIAFESNRLGFWDIWTCDVGGSNCDQVTSLHGTAGRPRWSPDGRSLAFEFHPNERSEIYVVEVPGGVPHLLPTNSGADNLSPSWSGDGKWLYFASKRGAEAFQIWRIPVQGGSASRLTRNGGISPMESPDGRFLYYCKYEQGGVWRMPLAGGEETQVLNTVEGASWPNWALTSEGIYYLNFDGFPHVSLDFFDFASRKSLPIWRLEKEPGWGLSVSRDGRSIVYVKNEFEESNLMLVRNFR
jgi:Tol biopolymer transport system component/DNA-binding winged helix-turn-helix (wHTH) protein